MINNGSKNIISQLKQDVERFLHTAHGKLDFKTYREFMVTGNRKNYESVYFYRRKKLTTFGLLAFLYPGDQQYIEALENEIWHVCNEFTWCLPAHIDTSLEEQDYQTYKQTNQLLFTVDLFAAETAFTLAELVHLFHNQLDDFLVEKVKIEIDRRVFEPFLERSFHWEKATHNWASVCAGSIGVAAFYLLEGDGRQEEIINRVMHTLDYYLQGFEEDGACTEGYSYWQYGFGYFVYFADLLQRYRQIDLFGKEKVRAVALFQQKVFLANHYVVHFSDAEPTAEPMLGFTHFLHKKFPEVHVPRESMRKTNIVDDCGRWAPAIRELWWYDERLKGSEWPNEDHLMEHSSIYLSRMDAYAFAAKAGHNDEPHNHNDIGQFILYGRGDVFLRDLGSGEYHKDYFNDKRYQFVCNSAEGHSIPVINGLYQREGAHFFGTMKKHHESNTHESIKLDISSAYEEPLRFFRQFDWYKSDKPQLIVTDCFTFDEQPSSLTESFIADDFPYDIQDQTIYLKGKKETLQISYEQTKVIPNVKRKSFRNHQGEQEYYLHILFDAIDLEKNMTIRFAFNFLGG
ncbi:heparinase II/III family protein [Gracilibacillus sp. S3-1-1]|uniref:Heparinase II/III family protein n=1 Tax=Gracilibacillus pellucidus TaxID=3095368 RepID=A0ACC6M0Q1_9BACI|nr:heparinase II/III family protein [Gracilibacillus sp. S3-1-1]MDX8044526.1 heparinase II/III family protein [Gracilibacillus sp. S3-1-1]